MNTDQAHDLIRTVLHQIAPEADLDTVDPDADLREELDLDSVDFLNFVTGLAEGAGADIPERAYPQVATLRGCVDYLGRLAA